MGRPGDEQEGGLQSDWESSVEGIYLSGVRSHHPFKVVECDSSSVQSYSRSGSWQLAGGAGAGEEASAPRVPDILQSVGLQDDLTLQVSPAEEGHQVSFLTDSLFTLQN